MKLLDPLETREGSGLSPGEQQRRAELQFPNLVRRSNLHYWSPGDPIMRTGDRYLLGLAASFDLCDLRLADLVNEALATQATTIHIDVLNVAARGIDDAILRESFPDARLNPPITPILGIWRDGRHISTCSGHVARAVILRVVGSNVTGEEACRGLYPPSRELVDEQP